MQSLFGGAYWKKKHRPALQNPVPPSLPCRHLFVTFRFAGAKLVLGLWSDQIKKACFGRGPAPHDVDSLFRHLLNRVELLRDVFAWAYKRSCARYSAVRQSLGEPDPFRLRYRTQIFDTVAQQAQQHLPAADRHRFVEVAETELMSLHEGNMARYRLRPSAFAAWHQGWR